MRTWALAPGDPLALTLAADFRLCELDYANDQIWELELGSGDPPAMALCTTYGLRARLMRIFPRFTLSSQQVADPAAFDQPPRLRQFFPNYMLFDFYPLPGLEGIAEYWAPDSHATAGRFTVTNHTDRKQTLLLELCAQLVPLAGQGLAALSMQTVNVLAGRTSNLSPVIFMTGGPHSGPGPYPSLAVELVLSAGDVRTLTWVQAALATPSDSFELARRIAARPWEAEQARVALVNGAQAVEVHTGSPDWDAALALSQKAAFSLFFGASRHLPCPSFVLARRPDQGYSPRGDGSDYFHSWSGQSPLEAVYLAGLLPGAAGLAAGLVRNFLSVQTDSGAVDWKPGLAGQRAKWLAAPLLASLAWQTYRRTLDVDFLREIQPKLAAFLECWFTETHDRDLDGFPEWDHPLQLGLEDHPAFTIWQADGQGADISTVESPALSAMLCREFLCLARIAGVLGLLQEQQRLESRLSQLRQLTEDCWSNADFFYHNRDRISHLSPVGKSLGRQTGLGRLVVGQSFQQPVRLLVRIVFKGETTRRPEIVLHGREGKKPCTERLGRMDFQWGPGLASASSHRLFTRLDKVEISGLEKSDRVSVQVMDFLGEDISLCLPLWAEVPDQLQARALVNQSVFNTELFGKPFGIPTCISGASTARKPASGQYMVEGKIPPSPDPFPLTGEGEKNGKMSILHSSAVQNTHFSDSYTPFAPRFQGREGGKRESAQNGYERGTPSIPDQSTEGACQAVHLPWNTLIGAGLLAYGLREEAAQLTARLMSAVIQNLKQQRAFFRAYQAETGVGSGERNPLHGLAPLGLFLETLGVEIQSENRVTLSGKNPFPWPVTVKYRGLTVNRQADQTQVTFPDGQTVTLEDPTEAVISAD